MQEKTNSKLLRIIEDTNKNEINEFYDYYNKIKKQFIGWSLLENSEKKEIQKLLYKIFNEKEIRKIVRR
jgi:hypothetical protein